MAFLGDPGGWCVLDNGNDDLHGPFDKLEDAEACACELMGIEYTPPVRQDWHRTVKELQQKMASHSLEIARVGGRAEGDENWKKSEFYR